MHLFIPLVASFVFVASLVCVKRLNAITDGDDRIRSATLLFFSNLSMALAFTFFWPWGESLPATGILWQPLLLAMLFICGLVFTFAAIRRGDISVATPIFGIKIIVVVLLLWTLGSSSPRWSIWLASLFAALGIAMIQWTGWSQRKNTILTIVLAMSASTFYANFDVLLQTWAPAWGRGKLVAMVFWFVGLISIGLIPWVQWSALRQRRVVFWLAIAAVTTMLQAFLMTIALAYFGDAARVNIIFAMRGLWAVCLAWLAGGALGMAESDLPQRTLHTRLVGASLLTVSVILAIATPF